MLFLVNETTETQEEMHMARGTLDEVTEKYQFRSTKLTTRRDNVKRMKGTKYRSDKLKLQYSIHYIKCCKI